MKKKPRFFCDHCGYEVGSETKSCPYCGRIFASVRCPTCGYSGPDKMFQGGCPMCGYSAPPQSAPKQRKTKSPKITFSKTDYAPFWTYVAAAIILLAIVAVLSFLITR